MSAHTSDNDACSRTVREQEQPVATIEEITSAMRLLGLCPVMQLTTYRMWEVRIGEQHVVDEWGRDMFVHFGEAFRITVHAEGLRDALERALAKYERMVKAAHAKGAHPEVRPSEQ